MPILLKTFFLPHGRLGRLRFWRAVAIIGIAYQLGWFTLLMVDAIVFKLMSAPAMMAVYLLPLLIALWSAAAVGAQRLHDRDRTGWWLLLSLVPVGGAIWYLFANGTIAGTSGQNRFGPAPDGGREIVDVFSDAESRPTGRQQAGLIGTIALWVTLLAVTGLAGLLFQNPSPRDATSSITAPH